MKIKSSQNREITQSFNDIGKSWPSREFLASQICLLTLFAKISEFTVTKVLIRLCARTVWFSTKSSYLSKSQIMLNTVMLYFSEDAERTKTDEMKEEEREETPMEGAESHPGHVHDADPTYSWGRGNVMEGEGQQEEGSLSW